MSSLVSKEEEGQLRTLLDSSPPPGATTDELDAFFGRQHNAARKLGEFERGLDVARRWSEAFPNNAGVKYGLWRQLFRSEHIEEALKLGNKLLDETPRRNDGDFVRIGSRLARDLTLTGNPSEAERLLRRVEPRFRTLEVSTRRVDPYVWFDARAKWHASWCELYKARARYEQALAQCTTSREMMSSRFALGLDPYLKEVAATDRNDAFIEVADVQIAMGRYFDAERTLFELVGLSAQSGVRNGRDLYRIYNDLALIRASQQRPAEARALAQRALEIAIVGDRGKLGFETRGSYDVLLSLMVSSQAWTEALTTFERLDRQAAGNPALQREILHPLSRALTYSFSGKAEEAAGFIDDYVRTTEQRLGGGHVETGLARGVRGIVLASIAGGVRLQEARSDLEHAVETFTNVDAPGRDGLDLGDRPAVRRLVYERYLEVIGPAPGSAAAALSFRVADVLGSSSTEKALAESAARSAASTRGLGDLVRRDQDAAGELKTLYAFLARQATEPESRRVDTIAATMRSRALELESTRASLRKQISGNFPEYDRLVNPRPPAPSEVARWLPPSGAFITILPAATHTYIWGVRQDGAVIFHAAPLDKARRERLVDRLRSTLDFASMNDRLPPFDAAAGSELYRDLLEPLKEFLRGRDYLLIATSGELTRIPFAVLQTHPLEGKGSEVAWLVKDYAITQVPTAGAWVSIRQSNSGKPGSEPFIGWGDPAFGADSPLPGPDRMRRINLTRANAAVDPEKEGPRAALSYDRFPALPETRSELRSIAIALGADPASDLLFGERATRASVLEASRSGQLARKRVVAFATHGLVPGDLPNLNQPALAMALPTGVQDPLSPLLTLDDVLSLKLDADWVVLSACNTASAEGKGADALSGLARGFFYAGARSLLVTHWAVETESAAMLTTGTFAFYAQHAGASKAESLRHAMLAVMEDSRFGHPAFWAPYALVGDGER